MEHLFLLNPRSVLLFFVHCCWFHKASFSSSLRQAHALKRIIHAQRTSLCTATTERSLQYFAQGYFKSGHSFQPWSEHHTKCPYNTFFPHSHPLHLLVYRVAYWSTKQIMALQELLKKNLLCYIDCSNEDKCRIRTFEIWFLYICTVHFSFFLSHCSHFSQP